MPNSKMLLDHKLIVIGINKLKNNYIFDVSSLVCASTGSLLKRRVPEMMFVASLVFNISKGKKDCR